MCLNDAKPIGDGLPDRPCISGQQDNFDTHVRERFHRGCRAVAQLIRDQNGAKIAASSRDQDLSPLSSSRSLRQVDPEFRKQSPVADYGLLSTAQG